MKIQALFLLIVFFQAVPALAQTPCKPEADSGPDKCQVTGGDPADMTPSKKITAFQDLVKKQVRKQMSQAQKQEFLNRMHDYFDFSAMAEAALFNEWHKRGSDDRIQFIMAFTGMLQRNYLSKLYSHADYRVTIGQERIKDDRAQVTTRLTRAGKGGGPPIEVVYRMHRTKTGWRIFDVVTDEVSLVRNYRSTFADIVKKDGFSGLMDHLKKQNTGPLP